MTHQALNETAHPSFGRATKQVLADAVAAPFGKADSIIRKVVPEYKIEKAETKFFDVEITVNQSVTVRIEAPSLEHAVELAEKHPAELLELRDFDFECAGLRESRNQAGIPDARWEP